MITLNSLVDKIAADLQEQIAGGKLKPGERLPSERRLCALYSVGRTTVREALKCLAARGLVRRAGRGIAVADGDFLPPAGADLPALASQTSIRQLFEVRKLLEVRIAGWAGLRATEEDFKALHAAIESHLARDTSAGNPSRMFHDALAMAAHNPVLMQIYQSSRALFFRLPFYWKLFGDEEIKTVRAWRHELACRWHEQILRAVEQRDAAEAEGAMFQHLDIMEKDLLSRLQAEPGDATKGNFYAHPLLRDLEAERKRISEGTRS